MKVLPLPYQISCVRAPSSNNIKRFDVDLPFNFVREQNDIPMKSNLYIYIYIFFFF